MPRKPPAAALLVTPGEIEAEFYEALQNADIERLMAAWSDDDDIVCVHPGGPRIVGAAAIRASFAAIFGNGAIPVRPLEVRRVESAGCAVHSVLERVAIASADGPQAAWVIATNVFLKTALGWRLVVHHASPGAATREALEDAGDGPATLH